jgi:hypothetical protein
VYQLDAEGARDRVVHGGALLAAAAACFQMKAMHDNTVVDDM